MQQLLFSVLQPSFVSLLIKYQSKRCARPAASLRDYFPTQKSANPQNPARQIQHLCLLHPVCFPEYHTLCCRATKAGPATWLTLIKSQLLQSQIRRTGYPAVTGLRFLNQFTSATPPSVADEENFAFFCCE